MIEANLPALEGANTVEQKLSVLTDAYYQLRRAMEYGMQTIDDANFTLKYKKRVADAEGNVSELVQTAQLLDSKITDVGDNVSELSQTAAGLTTRVSNAEGKVTTIQQKVDGLTLSASNGTESSTLQLKSGSAVLSSATIQFSGMVTFTDLSNPGATVISGNNISTGVIQSMYLYGNTIQSGNISGTTISGSSVIGGVVASNFPGYDRLEMSGTTLTAYYGDIPHGPQLAAGGGSIAALNFYNYGSPVFTLNYQQDGYDGQLKTFMTANGPLKLYAGGNMSIQAGMLYLQAPVWMDVYDILNGMGQVKYVKNEGGQYGNSYSISVSDGALPYFLYVWRNGQMLGGVQLN